MNIFHFEVQQILQKAHKGSHLDSIFWHGISPCSATTDKFLRVVLVEALSAFTEAGVCRLVALRALWRRQSAGPRAAVDPRRQEGETNHCTNHTVDGNEKSGENSPVEGTVVYPVSAPSQVVVWDFWTINSMSWPLYAKKESSPDTCRLSNKERIVSVPNRWHLNLGNYLNPIAWAPLFLVIGGHRCKASKSSIFLAGDQGFAGRYLYTSLTQFHI